MVVEASNRAQRRRARRAGMPFANPVTKGEAKERARFEKKYQKLRNAKDIEKAKKMFFVYGFCQIACALHEAYDWGQMRLNNLIPEANQYWSEHYGEDIPKKLNEELGIDLKGIINLVDDGIGDENITNYSYKQIKQAVNEMFTTSACCMMVLHDKYGYGKKRLQKVAEKAWEEQRYCIDAGGGYTIKDHCEKLTGLTFDIDLG